ncbi:MAG: VanW family protein, partial [Anaerolineae bacterium]
AIERSVDQLAPGGLVAYPYAYAGRIYPGVTVGPIAVGGRAPKDALAVLAAGYDPRAPVTVEAEGARWTLDPKEAGLAIDTRASVEQAFLVGRGESRAEALAAALRARTAGLPLAPIVRLDEAAADGALGRIADAVDRPAVDAGFAIDGTELSVTAAKPGRSIDMKRARNAIRAAASSGRWPITLRLPVQAIAPAVVDAGPALAQAKALLDQPIELVTRDGSWSLPPADLAAMLRPQVAGNAVELDLDVDLLATWLEPLRGAVESPAANPRFHFDEATASLVLVAPSVFGSAIDVDATANRILAAAGAASRRVQVAEVPVAPEVADDVTAADLGIETLVRSETSYFAGSPGPRRSNIALAASSFDGVLVPPDAVFSFNDQVGDITAESGYAETLIIMDGTTAEGVGGGVCQVSTTLFRAAFWSGLPIVERYAHGYRVAYYEQGNMEPGLDATIYRPIVDLKFRNDTGGWLLIETLAEAEKGRLTFTLYGSPPVREVDMEGPVVTNRVPAPPGRVEVDPSLPPGASKTLEYARSGADVTVYRIIRDGDGEESREPFYSHYRPTAKVVAVGPAVESAPASPGPESAP